MFEDAVQQDLKNEKREERCEATPNCKIVMCTSEAPITSDDVALVTLVKFGKKSANGSNTDKGVHKSGIIETGPAGDQSVIKSDSGIQPSSSSSHLIFQKKIKIK